MGTLDHFGSHRQRTRDEYARTGRVSPTTALRLGFVGLFIAPFWMAIKHLPGGVGWKLRQWVYRLRFAQMGRHSLVDVGVEVARAKGIRIGDFTLIDKYCQLTAPEGEIRIGDRCHLAPFVIVLGHGGVVIEDYVGVAAGARIFSVSEWPGGGKRLAGPMIPEKDRGLKVASVKIERDAFIGANAVVLPGVTVAQGAVVGANSVVARDVPPWTIVMGVPAIPVGRREAALVQGQD